jgi:putative phosphoribosyl transferase
MSKTATIEAVEVPAGATILRADLRVLLIVGGYDEPVIDLNRQAMRQMHAHVELEIVPGATHLFEEPGTLKQVAELAAGWFARYLHPGGRARARRGSEDVGVA